MVVSHRTTVAIAAFFVIGLMLGRAASLGAQVPVFADNFESGNQKGWTLGPEWQIGAAVGSANWSCGVVGDPVFDASGTIGGGVAGVVIGGNATTSLHGAWSLESPVIPLTAGAPATLAFDRWLGSDYLPFMSSKLEVFGPAGWVTLFDTTIQTCIISTFWQTLSYDVTAYANPNFRVRFSVAVYSSPALQVPSWSIDNLVVSGTPVGDALVNGGFEETVFANLAPLSQTNVAQDTLLLQGWQITSGTIDRFLTSNVTPSEGTASIDLNGTTPGAISTTLALPRNGTYELAFDLAAIFPGIASLDVTATFADPNLSSITNTYAFDGTNHSASAPGWSKRCFAISTFDGSAVLTGAGAPSTVLTTITFTSQTPGADGPLLDHVRLVHTNGLGQENTVESSMKINGSGELGAAGPFITCVTDVSGMVLDWGGAPFSQLILVGSFVEGNHRNVSTLGKIGVGAASDYSDVFVIFDGTTYPGIFYATLDAVGTNSMYLSTQFIPMGSEFTIQGLVVQPFGSLSPYRFTAAHKIVKN